MENISDEEFTIQRIKQEPIDSDSFEIDDMEYEIEYCVSEADVTEDVEGLTTTPKMAKVITSLDSFTIAETIAFIKAEASEHNPNFITLSKAMTKTYKSHRKPTYDKIDTSIHDIMNFHGLRHYKMFKEEYGRIHNDITKINDLENKLEDVLKHTFHNQRKEENRIVKKAIRLWDKKKPDKQYMQSLGILVFCFTLANNKGINSLLNIISDGERIKTRELNRIATPRIFVHREDLFRAEEDSDIWIYIEATKFLKVPNMYEAILCTYAAFYVCNIAFPPELVSLFGFFDELANKHKPRKRTSARSLHKFKRKQARVST